MLAQETIHEKSNEIPAFQQMLTYLDVQGKTVTADAMHCQRRTSEAIVAPKELCFWIEGKSTVPVS